MIELIAPKECPVCGEKMFLDDLGIEFCPKDREHSHFKFVSVYHNAKDEDRYPAGVNVYIDKWQFSFQRHVLLLINNENPYAEENIRLPPRQVETDFNKLQHKLKTILTFG